MCYNEHMDTTIRNLDEQAYRDIKARAALEGRTVGEVINDAIRSYVASHPATPRTASFRDLQPVDFGPGTENLSREIDEIVYGVKTH